ncbi:hypothetical protein P153DRAFT_435753 [Dothidotthia symphoricarpi CBS 119687]|uniref:Uncharacterized protein n=1 Tax=Dothidotthia symphoricarpi CBS 119687 TaxID=1392245 RepID=A0A6A5ZVW5_9PLEO|nr:uncharacterized protein P153DRAFT_435753 [Dothidotthia symphoricarpi CBS 119687]KAF2123669.1 hypothetical protein P153DRAFT_435753 [Dothidotthia symphoricarpi CBS 119687]
MTWTCTQQQVLFFQTPATSLGRRRLCPLTCGQAWRFGACTSTSVRHINSGQPNHDDVVSRIKMLLSLSRDMAKRDVIKRLSQFVANVTPITGINEAWTTHFDDRPLPNSAGYRGNLEIALRCVLGRSYESVTLEDKYDDSVKEVAKRAQSE